MLISGFLSPFPVIQLGTVPIDIVAIFLLRGPKGEPRGGAAGPQLGGPPTDFGVVGPSLPSISIAGVSGPLLNG